MLLGMTDPGAHSRPTSQSAGGWGGAWDLRGKRELREILPWPRGSLSTSQLSQALGERQVGGFITLGLAWEIPRSF